MPPGVSGYLVCFGGAQIGGDAGEQAGFGPVVVDLHAEGRAGIKVADLVEQVADLAGGDPGGLTGRAERS